jgi:hypothetical protein
MILCSNLVAYNLNFTDMNMKILRGTIFGGIAYFLLGWLIYGLLLMDFNTANTNQCLNNPNGEMIWWAVIVSNFLSALLLTLVLKWSGAKLIMDGLKTGAIFGILVALSMDLGYWSMTSMFNNFWVLLVDVLATTLMWALMGLFIVQLWGKGK